jgi:hypothetical protein
MAMVARVGFASQISIPEELGGLVGEVLEESADRRPRGLLLTLDPQHQVNAGLEEGEVV